jgi:hydroxyacylglutathione hydrolase
MKPIVLSYVLGPLENNTYLLADPESREAALIDPSYDVETALADARKRGLRVSLVLLTHAHFDHIAGVTTAAGAGVAQIALHAADLDLYRQGGGASQFGLPFEAGPEPTLLLSDGQTIMIGAVEVKVHHTPGHTAGHVIFVCSEAGTAFCGDLIFAGSVGRTDLPGGSHTQLMKSIRREILPLPPETTLLPGHGPATTVAEEIDSNPFLQ